MNLRRYKIFIIIIITFFSITFPIEAQTNYQYLFPAFSPGKVKMKNGMLQSALLNYNTVTGKIVYNKDEKLFDLASTERVDTVYIKDSEFIPVGKVFYEVLLLAPISLYIHHKAEVAAAGAPAAYGGTSQVSSSKYMSTVELSSGYYNLQLPEDYVVNRDPIFWIKKDSSMFSFKNEKQFLKIFSEKEQDIKKFDKQNRIKFDRIPDMVKLAGYVNVLYK